MSRNNIWIHLTIALVLVLVEGFAGGVRKWQNNGKRAQQSLSSSQGRKHGSDDADETDPQNNKAEILVRFRAGVTQNTIETIARRLNDQVEDQIESVTGPEVIEDEDGKDAE